MDSPRKSLTETVREALATRIAAESLMPGDRLPTERELIAEFGVSRTVVREALARLRSEGLVESRQGAGVFVRDADLPLDKPEAFATLTAIIETIEVRTAIEIEAARLAALRGAPAQLMTIGQWWEEMRDAPDAAASAAADLSFHKAIATATNNKRFVDFFDFLGARTIPRVQLRALREPLIDPPDYASQLLEEHRAIRDAIMKRDFEAAGQAMRHHLQTSLNRYVGLIQSTSD